MRILLFDNYDSFTYNLFHCLKKLTDTPVDVIRNDKITLEDVNKYDKIVLSPGPGLPNTSGILLPLIREYASSKSILGVCLGHQAIGESFGGSLINLDRVFHGVATRVTVNERTMTKNDVFKGLPESFDVGRYHSWIVSTENFPKELEVTATDENGQIMALRHKSFDVQGVQFHPESVLTPTGMDMMKNWLAL